MTSEPDFHELVGDDLSAEEEARLLRTHELLLEAGPLPELAPSLREPRTEPQREPSGVNVFQLLPRRRVGAALALAAAIALVAFVGGYIAGFRHNGFSSQGSVAMHAANGSNASAVIKIGSRDSYGNWPLQLAVSHLPKLKNGGYYEMYLTRGKQRWTCGTFAGGGGDTVKVRLTVPYNLRRGDGWVVVKEQPGQPQSARTVLTT
jgi:hypothetical protein